ncbi:hypothetical protein NPX13_g3983 [Xylaria arbuscula]|uniref:Uncharacterized protein n=1 Tax=Xylaria arbuscula TaxID=114810 RepID=A0A9W8NHP2_9PEZI|nr:hypothetical protein NPX13_g3983 [Xylaria arbuscula]
MAASVVNVERRGVCNERGGRSERDGNTEIEGPRPRPTVERGWVGDDYRIACVLKSVEGEGGGGRRERAVVERGEAGNGEINYLEVMREGRGKGGGVWWWWAGADWNSQGRPDLLYYVPDYYVKHLGSRLCFRGNTDSGMCAAAGGAVTLDTRPWLLPSVPTYLVPTPLSAYMSYLHIAVRLRRLGGFTYTCLSGKALDLRWLALARTVNGGGILQWKWPVICGPFQTFQVASNSSDLPQPESGLSAAGPDRT